VSFSNVFDRPRGGFVTTTRGDMPEETLERSLSQVDNDNEFTSVVEYRVPGETEVIHRSVHVHLKQAGVVGTLLAGTVGG